VSHRDELSNSVEILISNAMNVVAVTLIVLLCPMTTLALSMFAKPHQSGARLAMSGARLAMSDAIPDLKRDLLAKIKDGGKALSIYPYIDRLSKLQGIPTQGSKLFVGGWKLIYTDDDLTRSSPFFWSFKKAFNKYADQVFGITDRIPVSLKKIVDVNQFVSPTGLLISQVLVTSPVGSSLMTTTSRWLWEDGQDVEVRVEKTEVLDSTLLKLLGLPKPTPFPSGAALELVSPGSSTVDMQMLFLDEELRVSRNPVDDKIFVFERLSSEVRPRGGVEWG